MSTYMFSIKDQSKSYLQQNFPQSHVISINTIRMKLSYHIASSFFQVSQAQTHLLVLLQNNFLTL